MATVPTLTVGVVDQTAFVQDRTIFEKLKSLDFTLIDPATTPNLHDIVEVDVPFWHGRVSTVESFPYKTANGTNHRWVKVTCTNKNTTVATTAPFNLSDAPNHTTTFPYRDFEYIQTLSDQTDLSTAEYRASCIVYEEGLTIGDIVQVTCAAVGLSAQAFHITDMTVSWIKDDFPQYQLEMSVNNEPPVTLGDIISSQGCDCPPFQCTPPDYTVRTFDGSDTMTCFFTGHGNGQSCTSDTTGPNVMHVYSDAVYEVNFLVFHAADSNGLTASLGAVHGEVIATPPSVYMGDKARHCQFGPADDIPSATVTWDNTGGADADLVAHLVEAGCNAGDSYASSIAARITYLSGPDPRFDALPTCDDQTPRPGQPIAPEGFTGNGSNASFTLTYPYMPGSLVVLVEGVDWSDQVVEDDPTTGDFSLAYPPPDATDPEPNVEVHYRYPG